MLENFSLGISKSPRRSTHHLFLCVKLTSHRLRYRLKDTRRGLREMTIKRWQWMPTIPVCMSLHNVTSMLCPLRDGVHFSALESSLDHVTCSGQQDISNHDTSKGGTSAVPAAPQTCERGHPEPPWPSCPSQDNSDQKTHPDNSRNYRNNKSFSKSLHLGDLLCSEN